MQLAPLLYLALAAFAYRSLLVSSSQADLSREIEEWFFIPTETSPLVVVLLAGWLVYRRRERLVAALGEPSAWAAGAALLGASVLSFAWAARTGAPDLLAVSLGCAGVGAAAIHCGMKGARIVALPALLLAFAIPIPAPLLADVVYRFQLWTAEYAGWLLFLLGRSAYVSGDQILLSGDHFAVIEGCSGLRSVQTLSMVSLLLVELFGRRGWHALAILALAPIVAFALNGLRVLALILNPHSEVVAIHNLQGVAILLGGLALLYAIDGLLERFERRVDDPVPAPAWPERAPVARIGAIACALALLAVLSVAIAPWQPTKPAAAIAEAEFPASLDGFAARAQDGAAIDRSFLGTLGHRALVERQYLDVSSQSPVELFLAVGDIAQRYRSPVSPKTVPPGSGWIVEQEGPLARDGALDARWFVMRSGTRRVLVRHWYEGSAGLADETARALLAVDSSPWHRPSDPLALRIATDVAGVRPDALEQARERLDRFELAVSAALDDVRAAASRS